MTKKRNKWTLPAYSSLPQWYSRPFSRASHVGISGSVTVGNNVTFAGQVGTVGHITIGDNCVFGGRTGITNNIPSNSFMAGFPAMPHKEWLRQEANIRKLGDMLKRVKALEKELQKLQEK